MSKEYDLYLEEHIENVEKAFRWFQTNLPEILESCVCDMEWLICKGHDHTKTREDEYAAYDAYFYGRNRSFEVVQAYNQAWLFHIHRNPHHWQHWVLINDDPNEGETILKMPRHYIVEMICDWWSFGWKTGNLEEIFKWYDEHKNYIKFHTQTRSTVEHILRLIEERLGQEGE